MSMVHTIGDNFEDLRLCLYNDADHASDTEHAQSTSGMILCLERENSFWPLSWKKQTSTSRSTTEAEMVSLSHRVFSEALPAQEFLEAITGKEIPLICLHDNSAVIHPATAPDCVTCPRHTESTCRPSTKSLRARVPDCSTSTQSTSAQTCSRKHWLQSSCPKHWSFSKWRKLN